MKFHLTQNNILSVFKFIFFLAIGCHLLYDRSFLIGSISYYALVLLVFVGAFLKKSQSHLLLLAGVLYFVVFRQTLLANTPSQGLYGTWNHAIVFWVFLCLAFRNLWGDKKTIFAIQFLLVMAYFSAGLAKLWQEPIWINGYTLQYYLLGRVVHTDSPPLWPILTNLSLAKWASASVVAMELLSPLALLHRYAAYIFVLTTLLFHWACWYYMEILWMKYFGWVYLIFILEFFLPKNK